VLLALVTISAIIIALVVYHAEPILKGRIIETLSARFHGPVELSAFHVSLKNGLRVSGEGLKIFGPETQTPISPVFSQ
jgi:hypothetical protein